MIGRTPIQISILLIISSALLVGIDAGLIKNIFQKVTGSSGNKTEDTVKQSAPICGSNIFATSNENAVSPEIIFITNRASQTVQGSSSGYNGNQRDREANSKPRRDEDVSEVANEFRFNAENVTLEELERNGFNPDGPVTFLMHGFTSGYPLQAWMSAIVEAYTIDRDTSSSGNNHNENQHTSGGYNHQHDSSSSSDINDETRRSQHNERANNRRVNHNLFIVNWNYGARGIHYPRAVANIPIVATYVTRFINERLLGEARIEASRIQLIGHSLGAHLAGFIGKNTRNKLGRIYGLDPAGPCFGSISGPLYPANKRLASSDAQEVITLHTNTALLGINKPLGKYSVFVEGGSVQPGCKGGGVLGSLSTLTWDGGSFDTIACSHSRAPNLLTYRHSQSDTQDDCQLVAFECKDWDSFLAGHCGYCTGASSGNSYQEGSQSLGPLRPVECLRIGLDWQYPKKEGGGYQSNDRNPYNYNQTTTRRPFSDGRQTTSSFGFTREEDNDYGRETSSNYAGGRTSSRRSAYSSTSGYGSGYSRDENESTESYSNSRTSTRRPNRTTSSWGDENQNDGQSSTRGPWFPGSGYQSTSGYNDYSRDKEQNSSNRSPTRRPNSSQRERRESGGSGLAGNTSDVRRGETEESSTSTKSMFLRTGDTQPYCAYQYQVVLELNEPFSKKKPPMSLVLQDSDSLNEHNGGHHNQQGQRDKEQNSLMNDEFGNKFDDKTYTHLLTSGKKLKKIDHATILFRESLPGGHRIIKTLYVNYMSHIDPEVRRRFSSRLCPVKTENDSGRDFSTDKRFYFKPCDERPSSSSSSNFGYQTSSRRPTQWASSNN